MEQAKDSLVKCVQQLSTLEACEERLFELEFLTSLCHKKSLPLYIISSVVPELQRTLDEVNDLFESPFRVLLSTQRKEPMDSFQILVAKPGRDPYDAKKASGGERAFVRIVFKLAMMLYLNRFFGNYKVLIMDEPEKGLDQENIELIVNGLRKLKYQFKQIIIVTHNDYIAAVADNTIQL